MIYLAYDMHNAEGTPVGGHKSRCEAIAKHGDCTVFPIGENIVLNDDDIIIIDSERNDYHYLLGNCFSVLISDEFGLVSRKQPVDHVWYISGMSSSSVNNFTNQMIYTVDCDQHSWVGGNRVLFITGSNIDGFWKSARKYEQYCFTRDIPVDIVQGGVDHDVLMEYAKSAKCVITASGITAKEMIYMGIPCVLILTADNQLSNYMYFHKMSYSQTAHPEIISNDNALRKLSNKIKKQQKLTPDHMLYIIRRIYETHRRNIQ